MTSISKFCSARIESFRNAFNGLLPLLKNEPNARVHALFASIVVGAAYFFAIPRLHWLLIGMAISMVFAAELVNTCIELICDVLSPEHNPRIGLIKDMAAASVLLMAFSALCIGIYVFYPHIKTLI